MRRKNLLAAPAESAATTGNRAVIYCRVSTREQATEGVSLEVQERACRELARKNGWSVAPEAVFVERGESAKTIAHRPELLRLLGHCAKTKPDFLVIYQLDRLSRDTHDHAVLRAQLGALGTRIRSVKESLDETPVGNMIASVLAATSQFENDVRSQKITDAMRSLDQDGYWTHTPPNGYRHRLHETSGRKVLVVVPEVATHIRRAFNLMASGLHGQQEVLAIVTREGLRNTRGRPYHPQAFGNLLRNPVYAGLVQSSWTPTAVPGRHEAIVTEETFYRVQRVLLERRPGIARRSHENEDFPLRVYVRCAITGRPLTGGWSRSRGGKRHAYYFPSHRPAGAPNYRRDEVERAFQEFLDAHSVPKSLHPLFEAIVRDLWREGQRGGAAALRKAEERERRLREERVSLIRKNAQGTLQGEAFQEALAAVENERVTALEELNRLRSNAQEVSPTLSKATFLIEHLGELWRRGGYAEKQQLQRLAFPLGVEFDGRIVRTPQTSHALALSKAFMDAQSPRVHPVRVKSNQVKVLAKRLKRILGMDGIRQGLLDLARIAM